MKNKYYIEFETCDSCMSSRIKLTQKEFNEQMSFLITEVDKSKALDSPVSGPTNEIFRRREYTEYVYIFRCACSATILTHQACNKGYSFKE